MALVPLDRRRRLPSRADGGNAREKASNRSRRAELTCTPAWSGWWITIVGRPPDLFGVRAANGGRQLTFQADAGAGAIANVSPAPGPTGSTPVIPLPVVRVSSRARG